jgi:WD40 repeat protein
LLWEKEVETKDIDDRMLNMDTYDKLEGVKGALQKHVDEIYKALSKEEQEAAKRIFLKLVGIAGNPDSGIEWKPVRKRARLSEFSNEETTVLNKLINEKLLVSDRNSEKSEKDESTVEIAHEILLTSWKSLGEWIGDNRQNIDLRNRLNDDVKRWKNHSKAETELWDGSKLLKVQELRKDENFKDVLDGFNESANQFIDASAKLRDRKLRRTIIGLVSFSGVMLILAGFAGWQWWQAVAAKTDALVRSSDALFSLGKEHDALIESLRVPSKNNPAFVTVLQQAVDGINTNRLSGNTEAVRSVAFSSDGKVFASGSDDNTIKIWDFATRKVITTLTGHNRPVLGVSFSPDGKTLFSCSADSTIKFWDVATGKEITTLTGHKDAIRSISVSSDGKILASGSDDKTIKLWDVSKRKEIKTLTAHQKTVNSVSFSPDGKILASGSEDGTIKLWNVDTGKETPTIFKSKDKEAGSVQSVSFSPDGKILAYGQGSSIKLWDVATKKEIRTLQDSLTGFAVWSVKFSPDGKTLASGDLDSQVKFWDVAKGEIISTLVGHNGGVVSVEFSPDGTTLATGSVDKTIILWGGPRVNNPDFSEHIGLFNSLSYSPDGKILAYGIEDGKIKLLDVATGNDIDILTGHTGGIYSISFSPDGKIMASGSSDKTIKIWDIAKKKEIRTLKGHNGAIFSLSFSHDGKTVASSSDDKTIKIWDITTGKYSTLFTDKDTVHSISFSPDGKILASNSNSSSIKLWDVTTRKEIEIPNIGEYQSSVSNVLFSPDSKTIAFSSKDNTIKLLNLKTNKVISLKGHAAFVLSLSFSPDGKILASGSTDKTIKLWDIATGKELTTLKQYNGAVTSVIFSPDGKTLASADSFSDGKVIIRSLEVDKLLVRGCHLVRDYLENNPDLSETDKHLCDGVERYWLAEGEELARAGDVEGAIAKFKKAKEKDSNLTFDPQKKAKEIAMQALLQQVSLLIKQDQLEQAKIAYAKAQKLAPKDISAPDWNTLCWNGSLLGYVGDSNVKDACENAVKLEPKDGRYRDTRGFAKALSEDKSGAIKDFQAYLDWINNPQVRKILADKSELEAYDKLTPKRQRWIAALRAGNNPFTTNELKMIRKEEF